MLSSRRICTLARDAIRDSVAITYNTRGALITYQASSAGLDKKSSNPIGLLDFLAMDDKKDIFVFFRLGLNCRVCYFK